MTENRQKKAGFSLPTSPKITVHHGRKRIDRQNRESEEIELEGKKDKRNGCILSFSGYFGDTAVSETKHVQKLVGGKSVF